MQISLNDVEKRTHLEWIEQGDFMDQILVCSLRDNKARSWDGWIHASNLDWTVDPQKQFNAMLTPYTGSKEMLRAARSGNIYHDDMQKVLDSFYQNGNAWVEQHLEVEPWRFHGTPDRVQWGTPLGNILFEFKTENTYERDKTGGERLFDKFMRHLQPLKREGVDLANKYHLFTDADVESIKSRLMSREKAFKVKEKHLTQAASYVWVIETVYGYPIDRLVIAYIRRDTYKIDYQTYTGPELRHLVTKAADNYGRVFACLQTYNNG